MSQTRCWTGYAETLEWGSQAWADAMNEMSKTCLLLDGHSGARQWTDDDKITVRFR